MLRVSIVGYTNAGKSTLFNRLTRAGSLCRRQALRDPRPDVAPLLLAGEREAAISDTVGFIRDLPHELVAAFRSTLEEIGPGRSAAARG